MHAKREKSVDKARKTCYYNIRNKENTREGDEMTKKVMTRAWEIAKQAVVTFGGKARQYMSEALRMAWKEIKRMAEKKEFTGYARVERTEDTKEEYGASAYLYFKLWAKGNYRRIYINDYKRRTLGYIENGEVAISNRQGVAEREIEYAVSKFNAEYAF